MRGSSAVRAQARLEGRRLANQAAAELGQRIRAARRRRHLSQAGLGRRIGLSTARVSQIEGGGGRGAGLEVWFALSTALGIPLRVELLRDAIAEPVDAGHLKLQELVLRLGRMTGRVRSFELATKPLETGHSIDVCVRDDAQRVLVIIECWNTFGNVNASVRSTRRKAAEAEQLAVAIGGDAGPYRVPAVWIVRDTRANRELIARYPEVFAAAFTGSSTQWVAALTTSGAEPPTELGLIWCDRDANRVFAWRRTRAAP